MSIIIKHFHMRQPSYLNLQQHGSVSKYLMQLFNAGLEADDILMTGFNLTQGLAWNLSVRVDLWSKKRKRKKTPIIFIIIIKLPITFYCISRWSTTKNKLIVTLSEFNEISPTSDMKMARLSQWSISSNSSSVVTLSTEKDKNKSVQKDLVTVTSKTLFQTEVCSFKLPITKQTITSS